MSSDDSTVAVIAGGGDASPPTPAKDPAPAQSPISSFNFSIWPPSRRTRDAVLKRLVETLSGPSVLTQRYNSLSADEAADAAHRIEEEAFASATAAFEARPPPAGAEDDSGIETLQFYSKEISKRMLLTIKAKGPATAPAAADLAKSDPTEDASEALSTVESEASSA